MTYRPPSTARGVFLAVAALAIGAIPQSSSAQIPPSAGTAIVRTGSAATTYQYLTSDENKLLTLVNNVRAQHHLGPLAMNPSLRQVARDHSREMILQGYVGHGSPSNESFLDRMARVVPAGTRVGENVAAAQTAEAAHAAFVASTYHLQNMLTPTFRSVGIGIATAGDVVMVTEDFAE